MCIRDRCKTKTNQDTQQNASSSSSGSTSVTEIDTSDMFSDRDKEVGYEESESVTISLADDGSSCESDAVSVEENTVTITEEGTYILSGSLSDGMVIVEAEDTDKIQLVLDLSLIHIPGTHGKKDCPNLLCGTRHRTKSYQTKCSGNCHTGSHISIDHHDHHADYCWK